MSSEPPHISPPLHCPDSEARLGHRLRPATIALIMALALLIAVVLTVTIVLTS
ncbi:hypothetical protein [Mycobacterium sp.]|uniref:hypothetical protein n=1 Tax=Mycobacterium sp. TaxID=1785 RepID=UPI003BAAC5BD